MYYTGIDIGSTASKVVVLNDEQMVEYFVLPTGWSSKETAAAVAQRLLEEGHPVDGGEMKVVATGYGRISVDYAAKTVTEITCHGRGAHEVFPQVRGVIDIGGQDSKAIVLDEDGFVENFAMNDKCAAGTGRFLDVMPGIMGVSTEEMGRLSLHSKEDLTISSICTVFAESEVISLISQKKSPYDIMAGVHSSVTRRVGTLVERVKMPRPIVMTGGVGKNVGVIASFEKMLHTKLLIPEDPQIIGAIGAAALAWKKYSKRNKEISYGTVKSL